MHNSKPTKTPCCLATSLTPTTGYLLTDPTTYRSMVGALQYLTFTRLDLAFSVHQLCQFMQSPITTHLEAAKRVLHYVRGTLTHGVHLSHGPLTLSAFTMLIGKGIHLIGNLLLVSLCFWGLILSHGPLRSKPQFLGPPLKLSIVMATIAAELSWLITLFHELHLVLHHIPSLWCDNVSAIALAFSLVFHARAKHVKVGYHFIQEKVLHYDLCVQFVSSKDNLADVFTKPLATPLFLQFKDKLMAFSSTIRLRGVVEDDQVNDTIKR